MPYMIVKVVNTSLDPVQFASELNGKCIIVHWSRLRQNTTIILQPEHDDVQCVINTIIKYCKARNIEIIDLFWYAYYTPLF